MKSGTTKNKERGSDWLLAECEKLRQRCNQMTDAKRRAARQRALAIIYGSDATKSARRR